jgi:hypothetical protein
MNTTKCRQCGHTLIACAYVDDPTKTVLMSAPLSTGLFRQPRLPHIYECGLIFFVNNRKRDFRQKGIAAASRRG